MSQFCRTKVNVVSTNGMRGVSDLLFCYRGIFIAVEVKVGADKLRNSQIAFLNAVIDDGGVGLVIHEKHFSVFKALMTEWHLHGSEKIPLIIPLELLPPKEAKVKGFTF